MYKYRKRSCHDSNQLQKKESGLLGPDRRGHICLPRRKAEIWRVLSTRPTQYIHQQGTISAFYSTTMSNDLYQKFLSILRDRDVPYDRDAIKAAFNDPDSEAAIQAWIEEYLTPETLLTRDEAAL
jgi:hypothetical protein